MTTPAPQRTDEVLCACGAMRLLDPAKSCGRGGDIHAFSTCALSTVRQVVRAPQRTEETMPEAITTALDEYEGAAENVGAERVDPFSATAEWKRAEAAETKTRAALESAITSALGAQADRIAELEARLGTLTVALEMSRTSLGDAQRRAERAEQALAARHGGEPIALLAELDEARDAQRRALEQAAALVDRWHISKGGFTELAHQIRALSSREG